MTTVTPAITALVSLVLLCVNVKGATWAWSTLCRKGKLRQRVGTCIERFGRDAFLQHADLLSAPRGPHEDTETSRARGTHRGRTTMPPMHVCTRGCAANKEFERRTSAMVVAKRSAHRRNCTNLARNNSTTWAMLPAGWCRQRTRRAPRQLAQGRRQSQPTGTGIRTASTSVACRWCERPPRQEAASQPPGATSTLTGYRCRSRDPRHSPGANKRRVVHPSCRGERTICNMLYVLEDTSSLRTSPAFKR